MVNPSVPMVQYSQIDSSGVSGDKKGLVLRGWHIERGIFITSVVPNKHYS